MPNLQRAPVRITDSDIDKIVPAMVQTYQTEINQLRASIEQLTTERDQARGGNPFWDMARNALAEIDQLQAALEAARAENARLLAIIAETTEPHRVYLWLGRWRQTISPELVTKLQDAVGPLDLSALATNETGAPE